MVDKAGHILWQPWNRAAVPHLLEDGQEGVRRARAVAQLLQWQNFASDARSVPDDVDQVVADAIVVRSEREIRAPPGWRHRALHAHDGAQEVLPGIRMALRMGRDHGAVTEPQQVGAHVIQRALAEDGVAVDPAVALVALFERSEDEQ